MEQVRGRSRRARKRYRRKACLGEADQRGDCPETSSGENGWGVGGQSAGLWSDASLSELRLLRKAIRHNWPIPPDRRRRIIDEIFFPLRNGQALPVRQILGRAWVVL